MHTTKVAVGLLVLIFSSHARAQTYTVTDLGLLPGEKASASVGINSVGQIVGCSDTSTTYYPCNGTHRGHAFLWDAGTGMQDLGTLPRDRISAAVAINDSGEVVGYSENAKKVFHAFAWTTQTGMIALPPLPGGTTNFASGINAAGLIVGGSDFQDSNGDQHAVMWDPDGSVTDLGTLTGARFAQGNGISSRNRVSGIAISDTSVAAFVWTKKKGMQALPSLVNGGATVSFGSNSKGSIVGNSDSPSGGRHPVLWTASGTIRDLGTLPGGFGTAFGVNDLNQVVGYSTDSAGSPHAFVWSQKHGIQDLNSLIPPNSGWLLVWGASINNAGEITGWGTISGKNHAYRLTP